MEFKYGKYFETLDKSELFKKIKGGMDKLDCPIPENENVEVLFYHNGMTYKLDGISIKVLIPGFEAHYDYDKFFKVAGIPIPENETERADHFLKCLDEMSEEFHSWICEHIYMADYVATIDLRDEFCGDIVIKLAKAE